MASERFIGEDGKAIEWELKAIDSDRDRQLRKDSTIRVPILNKKGKLQDNTLVKQILILTL